MTDSGHEPSDKAQAVFDEHAGRFTRATMALAAGDRPSFLREYLPADVSPQEIVTRLLAATVMGSAACGLMIRQKTGLPEEVLRSGRIRLMDRPDDEPDAMFDTAIACITAGANRDYQGVAALFRAHCAHGLYAVMEMVECITMAYIDMAGSVGDDQS